jgi:hypothetical protein
MDRDNAGTVAVIDDDNDVGDVLGGLLETMGYQVETFRSGMEFLSNAQFDRLGGGSEHAADDRAADDRAAIAARG